MASAVRTGCVIVFARLRCSRPAPRDRRPPRGSSLRAEAGAAPPPPRAEPTSSRRSCPPGPAPAGTRLLAQRGRAADGSRTPSAMPAPGLSRHRDGPRGRAHLQAAPARRLPARLASGRSCSAPPRRRCTCWASAAAERVLTDAAWCTPQVFAPARRSGRAVLPPLPTRTARGTCGRPARCRTRSELSLLIDAVLGPVSSSGPRPALRRHRPLRLLRLLAAPRSPPEPPSVHGRPATLKGGTHVQLLPVRGPRLLRRVANQPAPVRPLLAEVVRRHDGEGAPRREDESSSPSPSPTQSRSRTSIDSRRAPMPASHRRDVGGRQRGGRHPRGRRRRPLGQVQHDRRKGLTRRA